MHCSLCPRTLSINAHTFADDDLCVPCFKREITHLFEQAARDDSFLPVEYLCVESSHAVRIDIEEVKEDIPAEIYETFRTRENLRQSLLQEEKLFCLLVYKPAHPGILEGRAEVQCGNFLGEKTAQEHVSARECGKCGGAACSHCGHRVIRGLLQYHECPAGHSESEQDRPAEGSATAQTGSGKVRSIPMKRLWWKMNPSLLGSFTAQEHQQRIDDWRNERIVPGLACNQDRPLPNSATMRALWPEEPVMARRHAERMTVVERWEEANQDRQSAESEALWMTTREDGKIQYARDGTMALWHQLACGCAWCREGKGLRRHHF